MFQWHELGLNTLFMSDKATSQSCGSAIKSFHFTLMNFLHTMNRRTIFQMCKTVKNYYFHYFPVFMPLIVTRKNSK